MYRLDSDDPDVRFTVAPVTITGDYAKIDAKSDDNSVARFAGTMTFGDKKDITYAWTGEAIVPDLRVRRRVG